MTFSEAILIDFAKATVLGTGKLNLLLAAGDRTSTNTSDNLEAQLPAWVPDLRIRQTTWMDLAPTVPYDACNGRKMKVSFSAHRLCTEGLVLDTIDGLGFSGSAPKDSVDSFVVPSGSIDSPYGNEKGRRDALRRTLVANRDKAGRIVDEILYPSPLEITWQSERNVKGQYEKLFNVIREFNSSFAFGGKAFKSFFKPAELDRVNEAIPEHSLEVKETIQRVRHVLWGRRLLTTQKGYIGVGSFLAQKGDAICILPGLDVPAILRQNDDGTYLWIGVAYIHSLMEGQAIQWLENGSYNLEKIVIV